MKLLLILLVCTLYAQIELTRWIVVDGMQVNPGRMAWYVFEIVFMWLFYVIGITFVVVARRRRWWIK